MKKIRILSVLFVVVMLAFLVGCGGGGGSSAPVEKDVAGISTTLNSYLAALRANDSTAAAKLLSSTATSPTSPSGSVQTLIVQDFGQDIDERDDNQSWTFYFSSEDIVQPSNEIAFVTARYTLHSGETIAIKFSLIRESGVWVISDMELVASSSSSTSSSSSFVTSKFFPIVSGAEHFLTMENISANTVREEVVRYSFDDSSMMTVDGINFYKLNENIVDMSATTVSRRNLRKSKSSIRRSSVDDYYNDQIYFGYQNGDLYMYIPDIDPTQDYLELYLKGNYSFNSVETFQRRYYDGETEIVATVTINIGSPQPFSTPLKTYQAVKVTETIEWVNPSTNLPESDEFSIYFAENVGIVGEDGYWDFDGTEYFINSRIIVRNNGTTKETNDPYISQPTNTNLGTFTIGDNVNIIFTAQGGDAASRVFVPPTSIPEGLTFNPTTGVLSGTLSGDPAGDMDWSIDVKVRDKYDRYTIIYFDMTVNRSSGGTSGDVTFSPAIPGSMVVGGSRQAWVLLNGESVTLTDYIFELTNKTPFMGFVNIGSDASGYINITITGDSATTLQFTGKLTRRSDSAVFTSDPVTIVISGAAPGITFYPAYSSSGENIDSVSKDWAVLIEGVPVDWSVFSDQYSYTFENVSPSEVYDPVNTSSNKIGIGPYMVDDSYLGKTGFWAMSYAGGPVYFELVITRRSDNQQFRSGVLSFTSNPQ